MSNSVFEVVATGRVSRGPDLDEVRRALEILADPSGFQLQAAPFWSFATFSGNLDAACRWVKDHRDATGVYYALNPVRPDLAVRVRVGDVARRRWLLVDVDRVKTLENKEHSATDAEHQAAKLLASDVCDYLHDQGWPAPVLVDSGNGFHLLYRLDLPADTYVRVLLKQTLKHLADKFDGDRGTIGKECHDARRISKLPGTWACRGVESAERPFRMCRLLHVPARLECVTAAQMQNLASGHDEPRPQQPEPPRRNVFELTASASDEAAWARSALDRECAKMALAQPGDLNNQLFRSAAALGNLVATGSLGEEDVVATLLAAGQRAGCDDPRKDEATVRRGIETGKQTPRAPHEKNGHAERNGTHTHTGINGEKKEETNAPLTVCAADITPEEVSWLFPNRIPKRFVTIFAGRTSVGKSFVTLDIVSRISRGDEIPLGQGECFDEGGTLLISEDPHKFMLVPRLLEMGADLSKVRLMTWAAMGKYHLADIGMLEDACAEVPGLKLIVIDPPTNFLGNTDESKNSEVRQVIMRLVAWVQDHDVACVMILHNNKASNVDALSRVLGSVAWVTTARVAHAFTPNPDVKGEFIFVPMKNNLGPVEKGLGYRIVSSDTLARVEWTGEVDTTADEAMTAERRSGRKESATEWLIERFREKTVWLSSDLFSRAEQDGISRNAIYAAKKSLELPSARRHVGEDGPAYSWWVPDDWPHLGCRVSETIPE